MTWFKVDDKFHAHPKVMAAGAAAVGLWAIAGSWSCSNLTNGFVPDRVLPRLSEDARQLAETLVTAGLWRRTRGGYLFHDWSDYQPDAEAEREKRQKRADAGRKGGLASGKARSKQGTKTEAFASAFGSTDVQPPNPNLSTSNEVDTPPSGSPPRKRGTRTGTRIPEDFAVTPEMVAWAREKTPDVDGRRATEAFIDYWRAKPGKGGVKADWVATWRNWMRKDQERAETRPRASPHGNGMHPTDANVAALLGGGTHLRAIPGGTA